MQLHHDCPYGARVCARLILLKQSSFRIAASPGTGCQHPRAMRRSYQDLARAAEMKDLVTRAISGHATEQMQQHYSTVDQTEMRQGIAKIISLAGVREAMGAGGMENGAGGMEVVRIDARNENGQLSPNSQLADSA